MTLNEKPYNKKLLPLNLEANNGQRIRHLPGMSLAQDNTSMIVKFKKVRYMVLVQHPKIQNSKQLMQVLGRQVIRFLRGHKPIIKDSP